MLERFIQIGGILALCVAIPTGELCAELRPGHSVGPDVGTTPQRSLDHTVSLSSADVVDLPSLISTSPDSELVTSAGSSSPVASIAPSSHCVPEGDSWQILPQGLLFHSYVAGEKEPRFAAQWLWEKDRGLVWETALGGRMGIIRHGTSGPVNPQGFQLDLEGAALPRVNPEHEQDLEAVDFRIGMVGTWRQGPWRNKLGYYHLSSHVGDEFLISNPTFNRINYVRDSVLAAVMYDVRPDLQAYFELAAALNANGGAEPWEVQIGSQYVPALAGNLHGAPFAAVNAHWREEFGADWSVNLVGGWMWRGVGDHTYRIGLQHYSGPSMQYSFFDEHESLTGVSLWMDF